MDFYETLRARRSIRGYADRPVPPEKLQRILEAARMAPTACNLQPFKLLVAESAAARQRICEVYPQPWMRQAPLIIIALGNRESAWKRFDGTSAHVIDVSIVMEHVVLAAAAEGLGTCWICAFDQDALHESLHLAPEWEPVAITPLGFAAAEAGPFKRKPVYELTEII